MSRVFKVKWGRRNVIVICVLECLDGWNFYTAQESLVAKGVLIIKALLSHSIRHITIHMSPLEELSARCREIYLKVHTSFRRPRRESNLKFQEVRARRTTP